MPVMGRQTPSASAAPSLSIPASVRTQAAARESGGQRAFAVSSTTDFTKIQMFNACSTTKFKLITSSQNHWHVL